MTSEKLLLNKLCTGKYNMINYNIKDNNKINIINEFRNIINFINYNDVLIEHIFQIINNYFSFETAGIFFNSPDLYETNLLHLYVNNNSININKIEKFFFNEIGEYKQIIKYKTKSYFQSNKPKLVKEQNFSDKLVLPFTFNNNLLGAICIFSNKNIIKVDLDTFNFVINEFLSIFKLKYMFTEQIFKSAIDPLTGLYNRNQFEICLAQEFNRGQRYKTPFSIAMIDIDYFKKVNDTFGHQFGDYVICEISKIIQNSLRKTDTVYRYGGEEIVIVMPETNKEQAQLPLEKLRKTIETHSFKGEKITVSIGVSNYTENFHTKTEVLKKADDMLYKAKQNGRNQIYL